MTTLRQLEYFVAIVDEGSFTAAAASLNVTQPGLSHQFRSLENQIGGRLLERLPRGVRLTAAGRAMLPSARAALADARRCVTAARRVTGIAAGELQVAALYSISAGILPTALSRWRTLHPEVRITLFEHRQADEMVDAMAAGQADLAIGPAPLGWDGIVRHLGEEEFVVVVAADDLSAPESGTTVHLADLAERDWVHFTPASGLATALEQACGAAGFSPRVAVRTEQGPSALNFAAAGLGPTLVPSNIVPRDFPALVLRPDPPFRRPLAAYTRAGTDPLTGAFLDLLSEIPLTPAHMAERLARHRD